MSSNASAAVGAVSRSGSPWRGHSGGYFLLFLIGTETFVVSPLLPTIAESLSVSEAAAAQSVTAYTLVYAVTAPLLGAVSDRIGRRPTIVVGAALFMLSNVVAAVAASLTVTSCSIRWPPGAVSTGTGAAAS
ncbi:MFS transporter [Micromonospora endophytica]|nr:MFS transporter [Micromonospora endophytica]BCJ62679.1 hypothetical protein Jiend_61010 [Micromonospora endophytica]